MKKLIALCITPLLFWGGVVAQIPVEVFGGHEKTTFDVMFFKFIKNLKETEVSAKPTRFLFFNRNRASFDYRQTSTKYLPLFGFTEAISYNHPKLKGFAPVLVAQVNNKGIVPKVGMQYFHRKGNVTLFSWVVSETEKEPAFDFFMLTRYEPAITKQLHLFTQLELINAFPTKSSEPLNFYQRVRLGIKINAFQFGAGVDFNEFGKTTFTNTNNIGGFLRYEFY